MRDRLRRDDNAAFPVLEAVLVAVLILTTILFFTSLQRPTTATDEGGIDLGRLAADTLEILQTKEFTTSAATCPELATGKGLEQWVGAALNGTACVADELEAFLGEVLPPGTQFLVRLDNGVEPLVLVPHGSSESPRAARAAATYITPLWVDNLPGPATATGYPGQQVTAGDLYTMTLGTCASITAPTGSPDGPSGTWENLWDDEIGRIPSAAPYGLWKANCGGSDVYARLGLPDGTKTDYPVYALQLVVWFGA